MCTCMAFMNKVYEKVIIIIIINIIARITIMIVKQINNEKDNFYDYLIIITIIV